MYVVPHVKGLFFCPILQKITPGLKILLKIPFTKFNENPSHGIRVAPCWWTGRRPDLMQLVVTFQNCLTKAPGIVNDWVVFSPQHHIGAINQNSVSPKRKWNHRVCGFSAYPDNEPPPRAFLATGPCLLLPRMQQEGRRKHTVRTCVSKMHKFYIYISTSIISSRDVQSGQTDIWRQKGGQIARRSKWISIFPTRIS
jgi:hypothetical protein